jgi:hypothetical protein
MRSNDSLPIVKRIRVVVPVVAVCFGLVGLTAWLFRWPLAKAVYLAPVIVAVYGVALGILVFWTRVAYLQLRDSKHPRMILGIAAGLVGLVALLTVLGIELPREGP